MFEVMAESTAKVYYGNLTTLPEVSKVLACLHEKDVKYEVINMNKGHHAAVPVDFLRLQEKASNRVPGPAFEDGSNVLFESRAICRHLSETYAQKGNKSLLGNDPLERALIEQWLRSEEHSFDPPSWTLVFHLAFAPHMNYYEPDRLLIRESERKLSEVLDVYNQKLGETRYIAGNEFSLADLVHLPNSHYLANSNEWSYLFTSRKHVNKWWKKISERQSWLKAIKEVDEMEAREEKPSSLLLLSAKALVPHSTSHAEEEEEEEEEESMDKKQDDPSELKEPLLSEAKISSTPPPSSSELPTKAPKSSTDGNKSTPQKTNTSTQTSKMQMELGFGKPRGSVSTQSPIESSLIPARPPVLKLQDSEQSFKKGLKETAIEQLISQPTYSSSNRDPSEHPQNLIGNKVTSSISKPEHHKQHIQQSRGKENPTNVEPSNDMSTPPAQHMETKQSKPSSALAFQSPKPPEGNFEEKSSSPTKQASLLADSPKPSVKFNEREVGQAKTSPKSSLLAQGEELSRALVKPTEAPLASKKDSVVSHQKVFGM